MRPSVLIVEDEKHMAVTLSTLLSPEYRVTTAMTGEEGVKVATSSPFDIVLLDLKLPDISGIEVLKRIRNIEPSPDVIILTAVREVKTAVEAMKLGAFDYIEKPFEAEELLVAISKALERQFLNREVGSLRSEITQVFGIDTIVGNSEAMQNVVKFIRKVREQDCNVLIAGETGTGKDLLARAIHYTGKRKHCPFVALNCACLPENMLESELFGHEKGAFTGADKRRRGKIELAHTGTLFLDEIGAMSPSVQAKILRVIEFKEFERLGGENTLQSDFRVLAASNADLTEAIKNKEFREDLYYRLNVAVIRILPLRERRADIPPLVEHFLDGYYRRTGRKIERVADDAMNHLISYDWPGNVRQLQNVIENALVMGEGEILTSDQLRSNIISNESDDGRAYTVRVKHPVSLEQALNDFEALLVRDELEKCSWDRQRAADSLGIHLNTVKNKIAKYAIIKPR